MFKVFFILVVAFTVTTSSVVAEEDDFQKWLINYKLSVKDKITKKTLDNTLNNIKLSQKVIDLSHKQPEQHEVFWNYYERMVNDARIKRALSFKKKHEQMLSYIEKKYNIDIDYLVALHALETDFGKNTGTFPITQALVTKAYSSKKRKDFFKAQLTALLKSFDRNVLEMDIRGSWAGAFGYFQFMPATFIIYGVDEDNDKKINLFSNYDAFGSAANYLTKLGLKKDEPCTIEVSIPTNFEWKKIKDLEKHSIEKWLEMGVFYTSNEEILQPHWQAKLLMAEGYQGPTFLAFNNFNVLKKWNKSNYYVISACEIVKELKGKERIKKHRFKSRVMSKTKIIRVQEKLMDLGLYTDGIDGIIGDKTRSALREVQLELGLPADGYPTEELLEIWNAEENERNN